MIAHPIDEQGLWQQVKQALISQNCLEAWEYAQHLSSDHPLFSTMLQYFQAQFPDFDAEDILRQSEIEDYL